MQSEYQVKKQRFFLILVRILEPASELSTFDHLNTYYELLSDDSPVTIEKMKSFDIKDAENKNLYQDHAYKIINADCAVDLYELNQDVSKEEEKYDGYYAVATTLNAPAKDILAVSSRRYKIEYCFRIMKTNFSARHVYYQKRERIIAHFMVCYTALLIYRLLENKFDIYGTHCTTENIIETLNNMGVVSIENMCYMSIYTSSETLTALNAVYDLGLDKKYYQPKELNKKLKKISK